ncbi:AAA family ATPase [Streptomyces sp. SUK 48]|uniref:AAA family ATPase n=1 Tax=Streptomyces sp. SUK 48 TaxID=2582831 RepID=UPI00129AB3CA|nr:AAA family ATPase [Streptomyces sp. SUK 48]
MDAQEPTGIVRRRLIVIALDGYKDSPPGFDEAIDAQVARITGWLADPDIEDARRFEVTRAPSVRTVGELRDFLREENLAAARYREAVVVYITGHGMRRVAPRHFLTLAETDPDRLFATAFPTSELITAVLDSWSEHVLVLVDSCFSGTLRTELTSLLEALSAERHGFDGAAVVTAGNHEERPLVGSFTERVALACERMRDETAGYTAPYLSFQEWEQLLDEVGWDDRGVEKDLVRAEWIVPHSRRRAPSACLPNPRYRAPVAAARPALRQLALTRSADTGTSPGALDEFWLERASGRAAADDPGWYFSGRAELMSRLTDFLRTGEGVLVVTGAAGSGKSALLARLVTLSDPGFAADPSYAAMVAGIPERLRPAAGAVDVAVLARNKSAGAVVQDLVTSLGPGREEPSPGQAEELPLPTLLRQVRRRTDAAAGPVTVVVDALDEASDPLAVFNDVVLPLARLRGPGGARLVRLLLGVRSSPDVAYPSGGSLLDERADHLLLRLTEALKDEGLLPGVLRSDGPDCADDIAAYAATLLLAPADSPYRGASEAAAEAATIIADAVAPSFLDARIAADQLRRAKTRQDMAEGGWPARLADGTTGLLREDVRAVSLSTGVPDTLLVAALRATAFAPGAGLPWADVWPAVTAALARPGNGYGHGTEAVDHALRTLRHSRLTGYLAMAEEDARTVYRPVHQRLTDLLLTNHELLLPRSPVPPGPSRQAPTPAERFTAAHASIAAELAAVVRRSRTRHPHPYVRRHFLHHATLGEMLNDADVPLELLAQETSGTLRSRLGLPLPAADPRRRMLTAAAVVEPYLDATVDPASRLGSIVFQRGVRGEPWEAPTGLPATLAWGRWSARVNVLAPTKGGTRSLQVLPTLDGRALVAVLSEAGSVRIWDAATGRLVSELGDTRSPVRGLCTIRATGGRTFLVTWHRRGVTLYDPGSAQPITALSLPAVDDVHVLEDGAARWKLFVITAQSAFVWRPNAHGVDESRVVEAEGFPGSGPVFRRSTSAVVRRASGHALVAFPTPEGIRLWDPFSGLTPHPPFGGDRAHVALAVSRPGKDDLLVVRMGAPVRWRLWDPFRGEPAPCPALRGRPLAALPGGTAVAYTRLNRIVVRDIDSDRENSFEADLPSIDALAVLDDPNGPRVVSAGPQGIRLWQPGHEPTLHGDGLAETLYRAPLGSYPAEPWPLCRTRCPGPDGADDVLVLGTRVGLEVHDAVTGRLVKRLDTGRVRKVEPLPSPPGGAYVMVEDRSSWSVWDLVSGTEVRPAQETGSGLQRSCVVTTAAGVPLLVRLEGRGSRSSVVWGPVDGPETGALPRSATDQPRLLTPVPAREPGTTLIAVVGMAGIEVVDLFSGRVVTTLRRSAHHRSQFRHACAVRGHHGVVLVATTSAEIFVWDTADGSLLTHWRASDTLALAAVPLSDGRTLIASAGRSGIRLWDPLTGELRHTLLTGAPVHALAVGTIASGPALHILGPAGLATLLLEERLL